MPYTPSWLTPPNFLAASEAGARTGLSQQEMIRQSEEHAAELALRADEAATHAGQANAEMSQQQHQFDAGNDLRRKAQANALILGQQHNQNVATGLENQASYNDARSELDKARANALDHQNFLTGVNSNLRSISLQNLPELMATHPELTKTEILSRFPALHAGDVPNPVKPLKPAALYPADVQNQMFKQLLKNSAGGTNVDDAISGFNRYMNPTPDLPTNAAPDDAAASLPSPSSSSPVAAPGYTIGSKYKGGYTYLGGDINDPASWSKN